MGLSKGHVKKGNSRVHNSGLFGITDQRRNSEANLPHYLNFKAGKSVRDAMIEAQYRKAQAITLARKIHYM